MWNIQRETTMNSKYDKGAKVFVADIYGNYMPRILEGIVRTVGYDDHYGYIYAVRSKKHTHHGLTESEVFPSERQAREYINSRIETIRL